MNRLIENLRNTAFVRVFGLTKVALILYVRPWVLELSDEGVRIRIPLNRRTRNHMKSMYFGTLAIGADLAGGLIAVKQIYSRKLPLSFVFKDFNAQFLKRPEADVVFTCKDGKAVKDLVDRAMESGERVYFPLEIVATCPSKLGDEPVAKFTLTLSLKKK
jgi:acyl-coenzyme A thioesterase PaaI-like protein